MATTAERRARLHHLHADGTFVLANAHDVGSARFLAHAGFKALATTSAGFAMTLGRRDMAVTRDELVAHTADLAAATDLPLFVDAERCFADTPDDVADTIAALAEAGAAGCSIEDWNPDAVAIDPFDVAADRVAAAVDAANAHGMVLTARCEHHLHGIDDLDATIERLQAFAAAGAHCVYAPGLTDPAHIGRVVESVHAAVNVLLMPGGPSVDELASLGVRRVSVGSHLAVIAYGAMLSAARALAESGRLPDGVPRLSRTDIAAALTRSVDSVPSADG